MHGKYDMYVYSDRIQKKSCSISVSYESSLQDDVDRSSSVLPTAINIFFHGVGLLSTLFLDSVVFLHHLQLTTEVDAIMMLSLSRTLLASFVLMIIRRS